MLNLTQHHTHYEIFEDIAVILKGFSWLCLVVSPWVLLAFIGGLTGVSPLSTHELLFVLVLLFGAVPQLIYCSKK